MSLQPDTYNGAYKASVEEHFNAQEYTYNILASSQASVIKPFLHLLSHEADDGASQLKNQRKSTCHTTGSPPSSGIRESALHWPFLCTAA